MAHLSARTGAYHPRTGRRWLKSASSGIGVSLSTGRAAQSCLPIIERLALDGYHIFFDGALVSNLDKEVYAEPIESGVVREAIEFARQNDIYLELYSASRFFVERETLGN